MDSDSTLLSVTALSMERLLTHSHPLVIPDIQRDYTWSGRQVTSLVSGLAYVFHNVRAAASTFADNPVGLIYGYTTETGQIHVIDGQQRLTTLFLLLGMLYRRTQQPRLRSLLISDEQLRGGRLPRIVYQAKRQALYFLSDLVTHFFLDRAGRLSQITQSSWYFSEYDSDASVQSFLGALRAIDEVLEKCAEDVDFSFEGFAQFVSRCVSFRYARLGGRKEAESLFVTINTTGEPLSKAQSLRARHVADAMGSNLAAAEKWNVMERFFWEHRQGNDQTSDAALDAFLTLIEPQTGEHPALDELYGWFEAYVRLEGAVGREAMGQFSAMEHFDPAAQAFVMVPSLAFARKFANAEALHYARFWHLLANILRYQRPSPLGGDTALALELVDKMVSPGLLSVLGLRHVPERIINAEERAKLTALGEMTPRQRAQIEGIFARAEAHPLLGGRLQNLLKWCGPCSAPDFGVKLTHYVDEIYRIWGIDIERSDKLDTLRRAMLALRHPAYPIVRKGDTILSLCWHDYDWQRLMQYSPGIVRLMIDRLQDMSMQKIIDRFADRAYPYFAFVKDREIMGRMRKKQLLRPCEAFIGYYDLKEGVTRWSVGEHHLSLDKDEWGAMRLSGYRCLYADHIYFDVAIALSYVPGDRRPFKVEVYNRADSGCLPLDLRAVVTQAFAYHKASRHQRAFFSSAEGAVAAIRAVAGRVSRCLR